VTATLDVAGPDSGAIMPARVATLERPRIPLVFKLFGVTALLIALVVAVAVGITVERANRIAHATVDKSISSATRLFNDFEKQRLAGLALSAQVIGRDPTFNAYIGDALHSAHTGPVVPAAPQAAVPSTAAASSGAIDYASLNDQIAERRELIKSDVLMLLDDQGRILARTDRPDVAGTRHDDLYEQIPLVKKIVDDAGIDVVIGVIENDRKLYHAAIAPVNAGANNVRLGYLVNAYAIDDEFANRIAEATNAGVAFVSASTRAPVARSSNAPSFGMQQMSGVANVLRTGRMVPPSTTSVGNDSYLMTGEPLTGAERTVGAAVFVRSLDSELAPFREIEHALFAGGGMALLVAFILTWLLTKRLTRPIEQLARLAQAVTAGDYSVHPENDSADEVGMLSRSFAKMITTLRDKSEIEELYEQMAAKQRQAPLHSLQSPKLEEGTVLVTDLRGLPATVGEGDASNVIAVIARAMRLQEGEVVRQDGVVREIVGHRLVSVFRGERGIIHAIRAARAMNEELATTGEPHAPMSIGAGIATGEFVTGSVELDHETGLAIVGNAPLLALLFAWHAPSGHAYVSYETAQAAGSEILSAAVREEVRLKWLAQPLPVASLPLVNVNTGVMRSLRTTGSLATVRLDATAAGITAPATPSEDLDSGHVFAQRYRIEQVLGRGGMGVVYRAIDTQLDETVAIKTLPGDVMHRSPEDLERFKREIRLARKITHRNVLRTYDYGEADGLYFISMEFVRGYTLAELLVDSGVMMPRLVLGISRQICRGLEAAHEQGIIHRDIKPQNVLIDHKGEVKLMDFGIARMAEAPEAMTQAGLIIGTPHYMSPEQVRGGTLDARSDVYSMGVMLYEMLVGEKPFNATSLTGVLTAHITDNPLPPVERRPEIGRDLSALVMCCLAKEPKARFADAGALLLELDRIRLDTPK
jgi:serine/threonine-protein kinase